MLQTAVAAAFLGILGAEPNTASSLDHWVAQLGAARWQDREAADRRLFDIGEAALPALQLATESKDPEIRHRARLLLDRIPWQAALTLSETLAGQLARFSALPDEKRVNLVTQIAYELRHGAAPILRRVLRTDPSASVRRTALDRLTAIDPQSAEAVLRSLAERPAGPLWAGPTLGDLLTQLGKDDEAIAAYEAARKLDPANTHLAASLAKRYERTKQWAKARDAYQELADARPEFALHRMSLARSLYHLGEHAKAEAVWNAFPEARGPGAVLWLARAYQDVEAPDKALAILRKGADKSPQDTELLSYFAWLLYREGRDEEAIATYDRALRGAARADLQRATAIAFAHVLRQSGRLDAYLAAQKADPADTPPQCPILLRRLAEAYLEISLVERADAARVLRRLHELCPKGQDAQWARQELERIGEKE